MLSTISTPMAFTFSVYSGTRFVLLSMSGLPFGYAATMVRPAVCGGFVWFRHLVKASTCAGNRDR